MSSFVDRRKNFDDQIRQMELIQNSYVLVGFQSGEVTHSQTKGKRHKQAGISMAEIAAENEFGHGHIPARPFLRPAFDQNIRQINNLVVREYNKIMDGSITVLRGLNTVGVYATGLVRSQIRATHFPPNSPRTIAEKKSSHPLIDFGQMIQSVTHKVFLQ